MPGGCWSKETGEAGERVVPPEDNIEESADILQEDWTG